MPVATIPEGDDVLAFLAALPGAEGGWVQAVGELEGVEVVGASPLPGKVTLLSLAGPPRGPLFGVFSQGGAVVGGQLSKARSAGVYVAVTATGSTQPAAPAGPVTWSEVAAIPAAAADDEADELPKYGDYVDHFVFGLCEVMTVVGERMKIRDATGVRKLREIHVGAMKILKPVERDGRRVFQLVRRG